MERARQEVDLLQQRWIETLRLERENFFAELRRLTGAQVYAVTRQVLRELADMELEERILQVLAERIETLDGAEREKIRALTRATRRITVLSAFDIRPEARGQLDRTLDATIGPGLVVDYQKSADMMSGCEFRIDGYKIAWSMRDYLDSLEEKFCRLLYAESQGDDRQKGV
jgi:F-type H+-transporting ATPase subunit b